MQNGSRGRLTVDRDHKYSRWGLFGVPRCFFVLSHRFPNNGSVKRFVFRQLTRDSHVYFVISHLAKNPPVYLQPDLVRLKITSFPMLLCARCKGGIPLSHFGGLEDCF